MQPHDSINSIPQDIQESLLKIAQYGSDPDQVKRWYILMRQNYSALEANSPVLIRPKERMLPPQTPNMPPRTSWQFQSTPTSDIQASPSVYKTPTFAPETTSTIGIPRTGPQTPNQNIAAMPWPTPESGHKAAPGQEAWTMAPTTLTPTMPAGFNFSPGFGHDMLGFTGAGLLPVSEYGVLNNVTPQTPNLPMTFEFTLSSAAMPVFVQMPKASPSEIKQELGPRRSLSDNMESRNRASTAEPMKKRKIAPARHATITTTTEPPQRPRRPSNLPRQSEQFPNHSVIAPKVSMPSSHETSLDASAMPLQHYYNAAMHPHYSELHATEYHHPQRAFPTTESIGYGPFQTERKPYRSPYI